MMGCLNPVLILGYFPTGKAIEITRLYTCLNPVLILGYFPTRRRWDCYKKSKIKSQSSFNPGVLSDMKKSIPRYTFAQCLNPVLILGYFPTPASQSIEIILPLSQSSFNPGVLSDPKLGRDHLMPYIVSIQF